MRKPSEFTTIATVACTLWLPGFVATWTVEHCAKRLNVGLNQNWIRSLPTNRDSRLATCFKSTFSQLPLKWHNSPSDRANARFPS
jgi:hypothetical protein